MPLATARGIDSRTCVEVGRHVLALAELTETGSSGVSPLATAAPVPRVGCEAALD